MSPSARRGFWIVVGFLALFAGAKAVLFDTLDPDCFWHLRVADQICRDGVGPLVDKLSFGSMKRPWTPYSWLGELAMKAVWGAGGYRAAIAAQAATQALIVIGLAATCLAVARSYAAALTATAAGAFLTLPYLSFRPVTLGFFILLVVARLMLCRGRAVWWVVPLTAIYVNVHLFAFFVPVMAVCRLRWARCGKSSIGAGAGPTEALDQEAVSGLRPYPKQLDGEQAGHWLLVLATASATTATPMLPGLVRSVWGYAARDVMVAGPVIAEMRGVGWVAGMVVALMATAAVSGWRAWPVARIALVVLIRI